MKLRKLTALATLVLLSTASIAAVPTVSPQAAAAADAINQDPLMQKILAEAVSPEGQKWRFNTQMEIVRIASPSRSEMRRQKEIMRRFTQEWGFTPEQVLTRLDGYLPGAGIQLVDGLPVYNACVRIAGTYSKQKDTPYEPVKLQPVKQPLVKTRDELASIAEELHFDKNGKIIEDENYHKAYKRYQNYEEAQKKDAYRLYVPGYNDAMINTASVMQMAYLMNKYGVKPVYDIWVCATTGEEGKGNLCGMKQLYGYNQDTGKGNNALNFVANVGADSTSPKSGTVNYLGSYRFEIKYTEPEGVKVGAKQPSALRAMSRAIGMISNLKSPYDLDKTAERTTYTVGVGNCTKAKAGQRSQACTLMVDMRSPTQEPLSAMRAKIEPTFKKALEEENALFKLKADNAKAVKMELVWFGDRPAHQRKHYNDGVMQAYWQSAKVVGSDRQHQRRYQCRRWRRPCLVRMGYPG